MDPCEEIKSDFKKSVEVERTEDYTKYRLDPKNTENNDLQPRTIIISHHLLKLHDLM